ncbi:MAG: hypothetical protein KDB32_03140 [Planctomycetes bacterium]|nr:hypothetical protein [Planctomycetota bacterium]MCA8947559.1 hypothetical protein [Planctomycetota bacterium]
MGEKKKISVVVTVAALAVMAVCCLLVISIFLPEEVRNKQPVVSGPDLKAQRDTEAVRSSVNAPHRAHFDEGTEDGSRRPLDTESTPVGNEPALEHREDSEPDDPKEVDATATLPESTLRWQPPQLDWSPGAVFHEPTVPTDTTETAKGASNEQPMGTVDLLVSVWDIETTSLVRSAFVEVLDSQSVLRAAVWIGDPVNGDYGGNRIRLIGSKDDNYLLRATSGNKVGFASVGTAVGSRFAGTAVSRMANEDGERFEISVRLFVSSPEDRQHGPQLRVLDSDDSPLAGTSLYLGQSIVGQTDVDGIAHVPEWGKGGFGETLLCIHHPGLVPVFRHSDELAHDTVTTVTLRAPELELRFTNFLSQGTSWRSFRDSHTGFSPDLNDVGLGVFAEGEDPEQVLSKPVVEWNPGRHSFRTDNISLLENVLGEKVHGSKVKAYRSWYALQWSCDEATGEWRVIVPHAGQFAFAIAIARRPGTWGGSERTRKMMYPGFIIDATDPSNPSARLVYPQ